MRYNAINLWFSLRVFSVSVFQTKKKELRSDPDQLQPAEKLLTLRWQILMDIHQNFSPHFGKRLPVFPGCTGRLLFLELPSVCLTYSSFPFCPHRTVKLLSFPAEALSCIPFGKTVALHHLFFRRAIYISLLIPSMSTFLKCHCLLFRGKGFSQLCAEVVSFKAWALRNQTHPQEASLSKDFWSTIPKAVSCKQWQGVLHWSEIYW